MLHPNIKKNKTEQFDMENDFACSSVQIYVFLTSRINLFANFFNELNHYLTDFFI